MKLSDSINRNFLIICALIFCLVLGGYDLTTRNSQNNASSELLRCDRDNPTVTSKLDCWYAVVGKTLQNEGIPAALGVYQEMVTRYTVLAQKGCHIHAHRVGDMVFKELLPTVKNVTELTFSSLGALCGYGFFHGLFEHVFQKNPSATYALSICDRMEATYANTMPNIRYACIDAAGHGFMLANIDQHSAIDLGQRQALLHEPITECKKFTYRPSSHSNAYQDEEICIEGVWATFLEYESNGHDLNNLNSITRLYEQCKKETGYSRNACYKLSSAKLYELNITQIPSMAQYIRMHVPSVYQDYSFMNAVISVAQRGDFPQHPEHIIPLCIPLTKEYFIACIRGTLIGIFLNSDPKEEIPIAEHFCNDDRLKPNEIDSLCNSELDKFRVTNLTLK